jgi:hypothetical protein
MFFVRHEFLYPMPCPPFQAVAIAVEGRLFFSTASTPGISRAVLCGVGRILLLGSR